MVSPLSKQYGKSPLKAYRRTSLPRTTAPAGRSTPRLNVLQTILHEDGLYQGELHCQKKQGRGAFMTFQGHLVLGHFENDRLNGKAVVFLPLEGVIYCHFLDNQMTGPAVLYLPGHRLLCCRLQQGVVDGEAYNFNYPKGRWERLFYNQGRAEQAHVFYELYLDLKEHQLPLQLKRLEMGRMAQQLLKGCYFFDSSDCSKAVRLGMRDTQGRNYYGFMADNMPAGLGLLRMPSLETYVGQFQNRKPEGLMSVRFSDKNLFVGVFKDGGPDGHGFFYYNEQNTSVHYQYIRG
jgi:hypothetical protein